MTPHCPGDNKPCYVREAIDDGHFRCGTSACPHQKVLARQSETAQIREAQREMYETKPERQLIYVWSHIRALEQQMDALMEHHEARQALAVETARLREAAKAYMDTVARLGDRMPGTSHTYFEVSPIKDQECFERWTALDRARKALGQALADTSPDDDEAWRPEHEAEAARLREAFAAEDDAGFRAYIREVVRLRALPLAPNPLLEKVKTVLEEVRDGHGCQPGYINTLTLSRVNDLLAKLEGARP